MEVRNISLCSLCFLLVLSALLATKFLILGLLFDIHQYPANRAAISATLSVSALLIVPFVWLGSRLRLPVFLMFSSLLTALAFADTVHFRFFGDVLSAGELLNTAELTAVTSSVATMTRLADIFLFLDLIIGAIVWAVWFRNPSIGQTQIHRKAVAAALLVIAGLLSIAPFRLMWLDPEEVFAYSTTRLEVAMAIGLLPYHLFDMGVHILYPLRGRFSVTRADIQKVRNFFNAKRAPRSSPSELFGHARGRNVIMIMAESLERFPIGLSIRGQEVAPMLARFSRESVDFTNFFDQTHLGTTSDAEFTSLQSLHPLPDAVVATRYFANEFFGLPAILAENHYHSVSANVMAGDFWNMQQMHRKLGFQVSFFGDHFKPGEFFGMGLSDADFFPQMAERLSALDEPFMAYLITLSNHSPYKIPLQHQTLDVGALKGTLVGDYLQSVHYFDQAFGDFIEALGSSGLLERSLVVVYGDHRAFWTDVPELPQLLGYSPSNRYSSWEAERKLPLFMRLPDQESAGKRARAAGHLDIAPTILGLLGLSSEGEVLLGNDLLADSDQLVVFRDGGFIAGDHIAIGPGDSSLECYEMASKVRLDCRTLASDRRKAREELEISDIVIRGNLIQSLRKAAN